MGRIVDYPEITTLSVGDYLIVDNAESGTKKVSAQSVAGTVDSTPTESSTNAVSSGGVWTSLNDISEEFDGLRTDAYDVYPKGSASSDIVQFETGADNVPLSDLTGYIYPMMSGSGMPSRTNIRTISGPDDINIYQRNKNLIEQITYQAEPETVYLGVQNSSNLTMFFKAGDYRITVNIIGGSTVVPYWSVGSTATHSEYMHLDNDTNVSIYVYDADGISASDIESFQVEVGTEATDHVEFEGDITNVVLPTDRGAIYSGRVALTAGKVYIDAVIYERNSSTMNNTEDKPGWAYTGLETYDVAIGTFDDVIYWPNGDVRCTNVNVGSTYSVEVANEDYSLILPRDVYNMSQSQWISAGVDIQILVKLNTPIEIDIDPVEVRSLYGFNTYYCNSGKTYAFYSMDLAKYISDKTTEVQKEEQAKLEKAFATDTASGSVASFADGADDIPMKSVKVAIEPVQDLHGYDNPWPAGGGKNLFDSTLLTESTTWVNHTISVKPDTVYTMSTNKPSGTGLALYFNNDNTAGGSAVDAVNADHPVSVTSTSEGYVYISHRRSSGDDLFANYQFQIEEGSTATDYAPYSNICPISGWTGANVWRTGKNLFSYDPAKATIGTTTAGTIRAYYPLEVSNCTLSFSAELIDSGSITTSNINVGKLKDGILSVLNGFILPDRITERTFTFSEGEQPVLMTADSSVTSIIVNFPKYYICVTTGSTATEYEPYTGNTYSITFPTEAGTVYGGELDVTNGVLTVDRAMVVFDGSESGWEWYDFYKQASIRNALASAPAKYTNDYYVGWISNALAPVANAYRTNNIGNYAAVINAGSGIAFSYSADGNLDGFKAFAQANPIRFCYELATPITYNLTPTEIKSLLGDNNVWADTGDSEVTYRADTKLYIDKKLGKDAPMIATGNIVSGSYFMVGNNLYKATANIASGAAVVVGTNATAKTMAEALNEINA